MLRIDLRVFRIELLARVQVYNFYLTLYLVRNINPKLYVYGNPIRRGVYFMYTYLNVKLEILDRQQSGP